jgi:hypothetical protein
MGLNGFAEKGVIVCQGRLSVKPTKRGFLDGIRGKKKRNSEKLR